jgi:uncharacterized protein YndB with AHSA1/START domain
MTLDAQLDLQLLRDVDVPVAAVWRAWTTPELLMQWFCPRPWKVVDCKIDLRPGGIFSNVMQSPEGQNMPENVGSFVLVEPQQRLVWTNVLGPDFRPSEAPADPKQGFLFVCDLRLSALPTGGTRYHATVMHTNAASRAAHEAMGFEQGWGLALDQLVALMKSQG